MDVSARRVVYPIPFVSPDERVLIQSAIWSPSGNGLVYCRQNDIYYIADVTVDQTERLTSDGSFNGVSNGVPDWTYRGKSPNHQSFDVKVTDVRLLYLVIARRRYRNVGQAGPMVFPIRRSIVLHHVQRYGSAGDQTAHLQRAGFI